MPDRRLAAILAADMVGYSRLMAADEAGTLARLKALRREIIDPGVTAAGGETVKLTGDGMLALFGSVVAAVEGAAAVQKAVAAAEAASPPARRIAFRIGLHLGDVMLDAGDIYGDGVNIAARLEAAADPGGVTLSDDAFRQVRGKTELSFIDIGELTLKNIPVPVHAHKIDLDPARLTAAEYEELTGETLDLPDRPSVAVLPFQNMSGDPEQEFFADGMTEDIITTLSRVSDMMVIARNSTFVYKGRAVDVRQVGRDLGVRYVLEGSVRKAANRVRITAQLINAATGDHVWAQRYDRGLDDIFDLQDEITREIVVAIGVKLGSGAETRVWADKSSSFEDWELVNRAMAEHQKFNREGSAECRRLLRELIARKPTSRGAPAPLVWNLVVAARYGFVSDPSAAIDEALDIVEAAMAVDPDSGDLLAAYGAVLLFLRRHDEAIEAGERSCQLNPNVATNYAALGSSYVFAGEPQLGIDRIRKAMRLGPYFPAWFLVFLCDAYRGVDDLPRARIAAEHLVARMPESSLAWFRLASVVGPQGDTKRSAEARQALLAIEPGFSARVTADGQPYRQGADRETFYEALIAAGLPE